MIAVASVIAIDAILIGVADLGQEIPYSRGKSHVIKANPSF